LYTKYGYRNLRGYMNGACLGNSENTFIVYPEQVFIYSMYQGTLTDCAAAIAKANTGETVRNYS
jgi:hypothetical protein